MILYTIGLVGLSLVISYYFCTRMRTERLQQDILDLRGNLFMEAHRLHCLDDGAYCQTRDYFNNFVHFAPNLSVRLVLFLSVNAEDKPDEAMLKSKHPEMQKAIDNAYERLGERAFYFLAHETVAGFVLRFAADFALGIPFRRMTLPEKAVNKKTEDVVRRRITSGTFSRIVNEACTQA